MEHDDIRVGHVLDRRELLALLGAAGASVFAGCSPRLGAEDDGIAGSQQCVARPQQTEGPFFVDERLNRGDIRADPTGGSVRAGVPLALTILVSRLSGSGCTPLANSYVDVWQCDALGAYSDVAGSATAGRKFLRGYQVTDAEGRAAFVTVYPGWYPGRTVHIHFKIRTALTSPSYEFTSQLYFPDELTDAVHAREPYAAGGMRRTRNPHDGIYARGGSQLLLAPTQDDGGYAATFHVALQL